MLIGAGTRTKSGSLRKFLFIRNVRWPSSENFIGYLTYRRVSRHGTFLFVSDVIHTHVASMTATILASLTHVPVCGWSSHTHVTSMSVTSFALNALIYLTEFGFELDYKSTSRDHRISVKIVRFQPRSSDVKCQHLIQEQPVDEEDNAMPDREICLSSLLDKAILRQRATTRQGWCTLSLITNMF